MSSGYVQNHKGKFKFTNKLYKQLTGENKGLTSSEVVLEPALAKMGVTVPSLISFHTYTHAEWVAMYQQFILQCKVPAKLESNNGNVYSGNKYSEDGLKAFQKALKEGYKYDVLRMAITLYYASNIRWKKAIGNYMVSGEWRTDYDSMVGHASEGLDSLQKHIKHTIDDVTGGGSHFELG